MKPSSHNLAISYLWLFTAGIDYTENDTDGIPLPESLATLLDNAQRDGRREAASHYLTIKKSGEHDFAAEDTGEYDPIELQQLLDEVGGK